MWKNAFSPVINSEWARRGIRPNRILSTLTSFTNQTSEQLSGLWYSACLVRKVVVQQWKKHRFADILFERLPPGYMLSNWFERQLKLRFSAISIPRVPTSIEIDKAIGEKKGAIQARYAAERQRFVKPAKILAKRILVPWRSPRTPADDKWVRKKGQNLHRAAQRGADLDSLGCKGWLRSGPKKTRKSYIISQAPPKLSDKSAGYVSEVEENKIGVMFFVVDTQIPTFVRTLDDATVQRELAAEVLRQDNQLSTAYGYAMQATALLKSKSIPLPKTLNNAGRQGAPTQSFAPFSERLIPGLGTSDDAPKSCVMNVGDVTFNHHSSSAKITWYSGLTSGFCQSSMIGTWKPQRYGQSLSKRRRPSCL